MARAIEKKTKMLKIEIQLIYFELGVFHFIKSASSWRFIHYEFSFKANVFFQCKWYYMQLFLIFMQNIVRRTIGFQLYEIHYTTMFYNNLNLYILLRMHVVKCYFQLLIQIITCKFLKWCYRYYTNRLQVFKHENKVAHIQELALTKLQNGKFNVFEYIYSQWLHLL